MDSPYHLRKAAAKVVAELTKDKITARSSAAEPEGCGKHNVAMSL